MTGRHDTPWPPERTQVSFKIFWPMSGRYFGVYLRRKKNEIAKIWEKLGKFQKNLGKSGKSYEILGKVEKIWEKLGKSGKSWENGKKSGKFQKKSGISLLH